MNGKSLSDPSSPHDSSAHSQEVSTGEGGLFRRPLKPLRPNEPPAGTLPNRYVIKESEKGRYLSCLETPEVKVYLDRNFSVTASAARKAPEGTIYLDGAAQSEPFLDLERQVYNLDHHEGCVRPFTLAACEQALVLVFRGMDIRDRPWSVYANEPDLDAVLGIWVLLNSMHLQPENAVIRRAVSPLIRLEGLIDTHGLAFRDFSGFPQDVLDESFRKLEELRQQEKTLKDGSRWNDVDFLEYTSSLLLLIDHLVYPPWFFEDFRGIQELAKRELTDNRIAVVCRSGSGIYELEQDLKRLYGKRLGVIVEQKDLRTYTLRQVDPFLPVNLEEAYRKLNVLDPAVAVGGSANRWGGSGEIGGSPRRTGTRLEPVEIAEALRLAYHRPDLKERLSAAFQAFFFSGVALLTGWLVVAWGILRLQDVGGLLGSRRYGFLLMAIGTTIVILIALARRQSRRLYGFQLPEGRDWWYVAPALIVSGVLGGVWSWRFSIGGGALPPGMMADAIVALAAFPLLAELAFRGLAHGVLVRSFDTQQPGGRWFVSWPVILSALYFAFWTIPLGGYLLRPLGQIWSQLSLLSLILGALLAGLALGTARERSGSVLASLGLHYLGVASGLVALYLLQ